MKRKSAKLKYYLAGRMGADPRDKEWRNEETVFIVKELEGKVLNPYLLEVAQLRGLRPGRLPSKTPDGKPVTHWYDLKFFPQDSPEYHRYEKYMRFIINFDMNIVENVADIIICRWSDDCQNGGGSQGEVSLARYIRKPVYMIDETKKVEIPTWIRACANRVFDSMEELNKFLREEFGKDTDNKDVDQSEELIN